MARPLRIEFPRATYHVMSRGVDGRDTFLDDFDRAEFLRWFEQPVRQGDLIAHALTLMSNHFHLLAETPRGGLGRIMQRILGGYSGQFNARHGRRGHLWEKRYKALLVDGRGYFLKCSRYIHRNPVEAGLCSRPEEYAWSSFRNFIDSPLPPPCDWIATERTLRFFESPEAYGKFVEMGTGEFDPFEEASAGLVLGEEAFLRRIREFAKARYGESDVEYFNLLRLLRTEQSPPPEDIESFVAEVFHDFSSCQLRRVSAMALYCCTWLKRKEIAARTRRRPETVTATVRALSFRLESDPGLALRFQTVVERFGQRRRL